MLEHDRTTRGSKWLVFPIVDRWSTCQGNEWLVRTMIHSHIQWACPETVVNQDGTQQC